MSKLQNFLKGLIKENPVLVLVLGTCPTLAISTSVIAAFGMGIAATAVLILSNMAISAIRKIVPDPVRIPCYIVVIAGFVTVVELVMEAYAFSLYQSLGVYLSLIVDPRNSERKDSVGNTKSLNQIVTFKLGMLVVCILNCCQHFFNCLKILGLIREASSQIIQYF